MYNMCIYVYMYICIDTPTLHGFRDVWKTYLLKEKTSGIISGRIQFRSKVKL